MLFFVDDENLPIVPPILVTVPFDYPENSPECSTSRKDYGEFHCIIIFKLRLSLGLVCPLSLIGKAFDKKCKMGWFKPPAWRNFSVTID
jgi:hypothetical protein